MSVQTLSCLVPVKMLKAALLFAGNDSTRRYLNGVCVQGGAFGVRLVATDGHRLFVGKVNEDVTLPLVRFVIGTETIEATLKALSKRADVLHVTWSQETTEDPAKPGSFTVKRAEISVGPFHGEDLQDTVGGKFPDWTKIVPHSVSGKLSQFNPAYILDCGKAHAILAGKATTKSENLQVQVFHNGDKPGYVPLCADAFVVVMPMFFDKNEKVFSLPTWFSKPATVVEVKQAA